MAKVGKSKTTPGVDRACEIAIALINDADEGRAPRFPAGTHLVAADLPKFGDILQRYRTKNEPVAIIYPDGNEDFLPAR